ncbi:cytochrome b-245 chaperone 1 isoform X2 [Loxodonta africana]|uniref:cytochrome b-245 chaperone 1 isoform X2 n=1 Tax=Loxodonta africana TaxID=9785 RepID=UPI0030D34404
MYMQVEVHTSSHLHLKRAPGIRSWSLLVGILSIGLAAAYYSGGSHLQQEHWESHSEDLQPVQEAADLFQVVVLLSDIRDVNVEEEKVRYFGKGYVVVLRFATGFSHPLTQSAVMGHRSDVEAIAKLITSFLELHRPESPRDLSQSSDSDADAGGRS